MFARVGGVFLQRVEDHGVVDLFLVLLVEEDGLDVGVGHHVDVIFLEDGLTIDEHLSTLDVDHLTGLVIYKVLVPRLGDGGRQFLTDILFEVGFGGLHFLGDVEDAEDVLIGLIADSAQQRGDREFFLAVDVGVQHVVDVGGELHPRALEGDDTGGVERRTIGVVRESEEHAR